jgi:hypothetical protein
MPPSAPLPVIPHIEGFGTDTPAGRGGALLVVDSLADSGPGTLRAALATPGPRTIVFATGGTIALKSDLIVTEPYVTIAGQTAPGPGVTLINSTLQLVNTHDVLAQHLRIRPGDLPGATSYETRDCLRMLNCHHIVLDHLSLSWSTDENLDIWTGCHDITVRRCLISEGLVAKGKRPNDPDGHSCGMRIGPDAVRVWVDQNIFAHDHRRNPLVANGCQVVIRNNIVYNSGTLPIGIGGADGDGGSNPILATIVGNQMIPGANTRNGEPVVHVDATANPQSQIYIAANMRTGLPNTVADRPTFSPGAKVMIVNQPPVPCATWYPVITLMDVLPPDVGARPWRRDATDSRVIAELRMRGGNVVNSPADREGLPVVDWPSTAADANRDGYTDLEEFVQAVRA